MVLFKVMGFNSLNEYFNHFLNTLLPTNYTYNYFVDWNKVREYVRKYIKESYAKKEELGKLKLLCNSEGGRNSILRDFVDGVSAILNESSFASTLTSNSDLGKRIIKDLEPKIRKFVHCFLSIKDPNWINNEKYVPRDMLGRLERSLSSKSIYDSRNELWEFLTIGDCKNIIERNWKDFENVFKTEFESKNELTVALDRINKIRAPHAHGGKIKPIKDEDRHLLEIYLSKISRCIESYIK